MNIVKTKQGEIFEGEVLALSKWDFIQKYLDGFYQDSLVTLSNDIDTVLGVIESGYNPFDYMAIPEIERDFSNTPFINVMQYVDDIANKEELEQLLEDIDNELFENACDDYKKQYNQNK